MPIHFRIAALAVAALWPVAVHAQPATQPGSPAVAANTSQEQAQWRQFRDMVQQYRGRRGQISEETKELQQRVTRLSELMRKEFQGTTRRNLISDAEYQDLAAGLISTGLTPLTQMSAVHRYKGEDGGLYGGGMNVPPPAHLVAAQALTAQIQPLDAEGRPSPDGKIVLLCIGMSNTHGTFQQFMKIANADPAKSPTVILVDGSSGGQHALSWADPLGKHARAPRTAGGKEADNWAYTMEQLSAAGVTATQVQVVWMKQAIMNASNYGEFPAHARLLEESMIVTLQNAQRRFPNLRIAYLSSRSYAGYAVRELNPEPYAYESAFAVRWMVLKQIEGDARLNFQADKGPIAAPLLLWGPYLWADGTAGRAQDDLIYVRGDYSDLPDGTHPSDAGYDKIARQLLNFLKTDELTKTWFTGKEQ